jgi:pyridoxal phosphate enzyme (YggS family)
LNLQNQIDEVELRICEACKRSGRSREDIQIIAVTKYVSLEMTERVLQHGCLHIGENRWQDAKEKWTALGSQGIWHFIGHLQSNKVKDVLDKFTFIHSLDRMSLAKELEKKASVQNTEVQCFIQVNVSGEPSKFGLAPEDLFTFAENISALTHLRIVGLMTMAPYEAEPDKIRHIFRGLRNLRDELNKKEIFNYNVPHLSMGMSNDFEIAIEEGATWIRLGSILVGKE